jgi:DNA-binding NarL/FixJ family response regulator
METDWPAVEAEIAAERREPVERRRREREQKRKAREAARLDAVAELAQRRTARAAARECATAELAELRPVAARRRGRPSLFTDPQFRALFERANAAGCTTSELAATFNVSPRTVRSYRSRIRRDVLSTV